MALQVQLQPSRRQSAGVNSMPKAPIITPEQESHVLQLQLQLKTNTETQTEHRQHGGKSAGKHRTSGEGPNTTRSTPTEQQTNTDGTPHVTTDRGRKKKKR
jgi:hypothetical protein